MELELWMLSMLNDKTISEMTGIKEVTIRDWRVMMGEITKNSQRNEKQVIIGNKYTMENKQDGNRYTLEKNMQRDFVMSLGEKFEQYVRTPCGFIDVLTDSTVYELKTTLDNSSAKTALGQILLYSTFAKDRNKIIVANKINASCEIIKTIKGLGISILYFDGKNTTNVE